MYACVWVRAGLDSPATALYNIMCFTPRTKYEYVYVGGGHVTQTAYLYANAWKRLISLMYDLRRRSKYEISLCFDIKARSIMHNIAWPWIFHQIITSNNEEPFTVDEGHHWNLDSLQGSFLYLYLNIINRQDLFYLPDTANKSLIPPTLSVTFRY